MYLVSLLLPVKHQLRLSKKSSVALTVVMRKSSILNLVMVVLDILVLVNNKRLELISLTVLLILTESSLKRTLMLTNRHSSFKKPLSLSLLEKCPVPFNLRLTEN